jgi:hypothetical protein
MRAHKGVLGTRVCPCHWRKQDVEKLAIILEEFPQLNQLDTKFHKISYATFGYCRKIEMS